MLPKNQVELFKTVFIMYYNTEVPRNVKFVGIWIFIFFVFVSFCELCPKTWGGAVFL